MDAVHYIGEIEKYVDNLRLQLEEEKKEITEFQKKFSSLVTSFSEKAPSNSVINSLFKDEEPQGFVFSKHDEKRKQLAEQRREEYNAFLEKKEKERMSKKRFTEESRSVTPRSILDSVDYEQILAKRKEEEAKFRTMNLSDVLDSTRPILNESNRKPVSDLNMLNRSENTPSFHRNNINMTAVNLPGSVITTEELEQKKSSDALEKEDARILEERIAKRLEEQRRQMLIEFENVLKKNNKVTDEIQKLRTSANSVRSQHERVNTRMEEFPRFDRTGGGGDSFRNSYANLRNEEYPKFGRTGGGGEPVRDPYGNLITLRGSKTESDSDYKSIISFPSMQQQPVKDRMALYREELQRQIEEKKRLEALEKAKTREMEERWAQRMEEQRLKMQKEYDEELKRTNKVKEEFQRQQERIRKLEEFQRKDAEERRKKMLEARPPEPEKPPAPEIVSERSQSPPIPAVRTKVLLEKAVPPVTTKASLPEVKPENVFSSLAEIRRQIMKEQQKPIKDTKKSYKVMNRRTVQDVSDEDEEDDILKSSSQYTDFSAS